MFRITYYVFSFLYINNMCISSGLFDVSKIAVLPNINAISGVVKYFDMPYF